MHQGTIEEEVAREVPITDTGVVVVLQEVEIVMKKSGGISIHTTKGEIIIMMMDAFATQEATGKMHLKRLNWEGILTQLFAREYIMKSCLLLMREI